MNRVRKTPLKHLSEDHMHLSEFQHAKAHDLLSEDGTLVKVKDGVDYQESISSSLEPKNIFEEQTSEKEETKIEVGTGSIPSMNYQDFVDSGKYNSSQLDIIKSRLLELNPGKDLQDIEIGWNAANVDGSIFNPPEEVSVPGNTKIDNLSIDVNAFSTFTANNPIYEKHHGLESNILDKDNFNWTSEEDLVPFLNEFYKDKGVDVRFEETNPGTLVDWATSRTSWDAIEILIGDQESGEGHTIELQPSGGLTLSSLTSQIRSHIDVNMGDRYQKLEEESLTDNQEETYDAVLESLDVSTLFLDDNPINQARFAHQGDINQGLFKEEDSRIMYLDPNAEGTGDRLNQYTYDKIIGTGALELFTFGSHEKYYADMKGGITLNNGKFVPYQWLWDNREKIRQRGLNNMGITLTEEKIKEFGSEQEFNQYIADNAYLWFDDADEREYYLVKNELSKIKAGEESFYTESEAVGIIERIAKDKGWKTLYDENGKFYNIVKNEEEEEEVILIETEAKKLAEKTDAQTLEKLRQQSAVRLENLAYVAYKNINQVGEEIAWYEKIGGLFDFSGDSYDNDKANLQKVAELKDLFGADSPLTNLPGGAVLSEEFNQELLNFKTLSRAYDLNIDISQNPQENFWAETFDNLSRTLTGDDVFGTIEDESRDAFEGILEQEGYIVDKLDEVYEEFIETEDAQGNVIVTRNPKYVPWSFWSRRTAETTSQVATDLAPLLIELYAFKKAGGLKKIDNTVRALSGKLTGKITKKSPMWAKFVDKLVVPAVVTTAEWSSAELIGEAIMGGGAGTWDAHTINTTTGETNFTMPMVMGSMGVVWNRLSKSLYNGVSKTRMGERILPQLTNPQGFLHGTRKAGMKFVGTGTTGTAMLMVAETAQAVVDDLMKKGKIREAKEFKEIWNAEHFVTMAMALSVLSFRKIAPEAYDAFKTDVLHLKGKTKESNAAAKYFKVKEGIESEKIEEALKEKINTIKSNKKTSKKEKDKEIKIAKNHAKHLKLFNEIKLIKDRYKQKGRRSEYIKETWKDWETMKKDPSKLTVEEYERLSELSNNEIIELLRRNKIDISSSTGKFYQNAHEVIQGLTHTADYLELGKDSKERQTYLQNTIKTMVNKNRMDSIKKEIKEGKGSTTQLEIELKKLKETNERLFEQNEGLYDGFQKKWNEMLKHEVELAKHLAKQLGSSVTEMNSTQWREEGFEEGRDAAYVNGKLYLNMDVIRQTRNIGAPVHEVMHHILRNSLKDANGKMTKEGIKTIKLLLDKFTLREQAKIQKRIDDNYKFEENPDGTFKLDEKGKKIEKPEEDYYEEYVTAISDAIKNGEIKYNAKTMRNVKSTLFPLFKRFMPNLYRYDINGSNSQKASKDLFNLLGDVSAAKKVKKETIEGIKDIDTYGVEVKEGTVRESKSLYKDKFLTEEFGITKESTKKIVETNNKLEKKIFEENLRDENGNLKASLENQRKLVENNLPAAFKLALKASNKAKDITLEQGMKYDNVMDWYSDYSVKLVDLARTYRAERVVNPKTKKPISPPEKVPFGAYMGGLLPKKYQGILEQGKKKLETKSTSDEGVARQVARIKADNITKVGEVGKGIVVHERFKRQGSKEASLIHEKVKNMVSFVSEKPYLRKGEVDIDITKQTYKSLKNVTLREVQMMFGIDPKSGNLSKPDVKNSQHFINKNVETLISLLPKHHTVKMVNVGTPKNPVYEARPDKATGVQQVILDAFYKKGIRKDNLTPWTRKEVIDINNFLDVFGIKERNQPNLYKKESNTSARIHALVKLTEQAMVNQAVRERLMEKGEGQRAFASAVAEGKSDAIYSKSVYRNKNVTEQTKKYFDINKRKFHYEISIQGLTKEGYRRAYDIAFKDGIFDNSGKNLRSEIVKDYEKILSPYVKVQETYLSVGKNLKDIKSVVEYLSIKNIAEPRVFVAEYFGVEGSMRDVRTRNKGKEIDNQKTAMLDISSNRLNKKLEDVIDTKERLEISDRHIINEIRAKNHVEDGTVVGKPGSYRPMLYNLKNGYIKDYLSKHPGYEGLIGYERKSKKDKKTGKTDYWVELQFEGGKTRKVSMPESSILDGKKGQKTTKEMVEGNMSAKEKSLRKEHRDFHWDAMVETMTSLKETYSKREDYNVRKAMLMEGYLGNMGTSLRAAALFKYSPVNPPTLNLTRTVWNAKKKKYVEEKLWEYEHGIPAKKMVILLSEAIFNGKKIDLQKLKESYSTGVIHVDFNTNIGRVFKERMQFDYQLYDIAPKRWFNLWTAMGEAHAVKDVFTGEIYGQSQVNYWNNVKTEYKKSTNNLNKSVSKVLNGKYSKSNKKDIINDIRDIDKAINLSRNPNKERKGMSTWDFDDTLATTKSGVRATIPNPSGLPKPKRKVIFLAGGAGSGKSNVVKKLELEKQGFKIVNQDISLEWLKKNSGLPENMNDLTKEQNSTLGKLSYQARAIAKRKMMKFQGNGEGVVVDGTGGSIKSMQNLVKEFKEKGYDVSMLFVETSLQTALQRNKDRKERSLLDKIVEKNHEKVQGNKQAFELLFRDRFMEVKTDNLKQEDAMPIELVEKMNDFVSGYEKRRLDAEEFATEGQKILEQGGKFDFSEFNVVTQGAKGPFFQKALNRAKKFGTEHQYVLTARPPESQRPIYEFLKEMGLEIPLKNITGLGNSTAEAKALWMLKKFSEGYNDMYFADDAIQNVKEVKNVLDQLDIKSKVQQAKYSKSNRDVVSKKFNKILEESKGVDRNMSISEADIKRLTGFGTFMKGWGAEDFAGLVTYAFSGKGKQGEAHKQFFEEHLHKPFNRAYNDIHARKQNISNDYKALRKNMPDVVKELNSRLNEFEGYNSNITVENAIRMHLWNKAGYEIPGVSKRNLKEALEFIKTDAELSLFADQLSQITMLPEGYLKPSKNWLGENLTIDMNNVVDRIYRKDALYEFVENRKSIFGEWDGGRLVGENMNKIESIFGQKHREALENILWRMENGTNRTVGADSNTNRWMNWVNSATGTIMFFNQKSAALQTISTLNYVNGTFNNPLRAAQAFANQPQYWKDFVKIFNSDMMLQRRSGLKINVEAAELIDRVGGSKDKASAALAYLLEKGFIPTKYADSFAIALGGATYYRNSVRRHMKRGMSKVEAEKKAWEDFTEMTEATQQSSRPDLISMQQASALGRPILAFANTPMQMFRRHKRRIQDIASNRGNMAENVGSALYYGFAQTMVFAYLQQALFAVDDESTEDFVEKKESRFVNTILDSYLRGMGTGGASVSALKNGILSFKNESEKGWNADYGNTVIDMLNVSPPIGSKARKVYSALKTYKYNSDIMPEMGISLDNPATLAIANLISAATNIPTDRAVMKLQNINDAWNGDFENWQRVAMLMGWNKWTLGIEDKELKAEKDEIRSRVKDKKKNKNKEEKLKEKHPDKSTDEINLIQKSDETYDLNKRQQVKIIEGLNLNPKDYPKEKDRVDIIMKYYSEDPQKIDSTLNAIKNYVPSESEQRSIDLFKMTKKDQVNLLLQLGLSTKAIKKLKYEEDRVNRIIQLESKKKVKNNENK